MRSFFGRSFFWESLPMCLLISLSSIVMNAGVLFALPFNTDMFSSEKLMPGNSSRNFVEGTIPVGSLANRVENKDQALTLVNPFRNDKRSSFLGKRLYDVNCSSCHGWFEETGTKPAAIASKMLMPGPDLSLDFYRQKDDGLFYGTIHFGGYVFMPPVGWRISPDETWHIVSYLREVQSKQASAK